MLKARERQTDHIEIAALDARNVAGGVALNGVSASLVVRLAGSEIARDFFLGQGRERDKSGLDKGDAFGVGKANKTHAGEDRVSATGKFREHAAGVVGGAWLAEDVAVEEDFRIRGDDNGGTDCARDGEFGFGFGKTEDEVLRRFAGERRFVNG